jgi:hypothetical protein
MHGPCPDGTIKWRENEPPYVEIRMGDQLLVAGWVFPTPDGPQKAVVAEPDPMMEGSHNDLRRIMPARPRVGGLLTVYRELSEGNLEYHADDETFIHDK